MWRDDLKLAVEFYASGPPMIDPIFLWSVNWPSNNPWPETLPSCDSLLDFYALCDGGCFGPMMNFLAMVDLPVQTKKWIETLRNYDDNGDVLIPQRHLVIANDADGAPWVFDATDQSVQCYYWKSGEWCDPRYDSHDDFMDAMMYKDPNSADWIKTLEIMRQTNG